MADLVACGWCGAHTGPGQCASCGRDPEAAWRQRGRPAPVVERAAGRPTLDQAAIVRDYTAARERLLAAGRRPTVAAIAEALDVAERTVRDWRQRFGLPA